MSSEELFGISEIAVNTTLAAMLCDLGYLAGGEIVTRARSQIRKPDVLIQLSGMRVILEGKLDKPTARAELEAQCKERIDDELCEVSIGIVYRLSQPRNGLFDNVSDIGLRKLIREGQYDIAVWGLGSTEPTLLQDWTTKPFAGIAESICGAVYEAQSIDVLSEAVARIRSVIEDSAAPLLACYTQGLKHIADVIAPKLELRQPKNQREQIQTVKIAFLVLLDAAIFYTSLIGKHKLQNLEYHKDSEGSYAEGFRRAFNTALDINYAAVFEIALDLLNTLPPEADQALGNLAKTSLSIVKDRLLLKHDLMGRIFHMLLFEDLAKHLATYYTAITSAWLLAALAFETPGASWSDKDLSDLENIKQMRIADFACGSGTLLSAAYQEFKRLHIDQSNLSGNKPNRNALHTMLLDDVIHGYDVMLYAAHIATVTLAMHNPDSTFKEGKIFVLPFGDEEKSIGSLEFLVRESLRARSTAHRIDIKKGKAKGEIKVEPESFDLVIMNPPFARSSGEVNLLFGSVKDEKLRIAMKERHYSILDSYGLRGIGQAGLGAAFIGLADRFVKPGGRIAFVLPRNFLSGVSWRLTRDLLIGLDGDGNQVSGKNQYFLEYVLLSVEQNNYNFSENTNLSECMFVARKIEDNEKPNRTVFYLFDRKPKTVFDAREAAEMLLTCFNFVQSERNNSAFSDCSNIGNLGRNLFAGFGRCYSVSSEVVRENVDNWGRLVAFAVPELTIAAYRLRTTGCLNIGAYYSSSIPITDLKNLCTIGFDRKQTGTNFKESDTGAYDALWGRSKSMSRIFQEPNAKLTTTTSRDVTKQLITSSRLVITERIRLNTTPVVSLLCSKPVLSNVWWPLKLVRQDNQARNNEKALCMWFNSSLGLLLHFSELFVTAGAFAGIKKTPLEVLPVLDINSLSESQIDALADLFDELAEKEFPVLGTQFEQASRGEGSRLRLDTRLLEIVTGKKPDADSLVPLYNLLVAESKHW